MREIKFRIWDGNNKRYVYPEIIELNRGLEYEQFTGLKDKNGKEIYEGDILQYKYYWATKRWWSQTEDIPEIQDEVNRQRADYSINKTVIIMRGGAFYADYYLHDIECGGKLDSKLETGRTRGSDYEWKAWDFEVIGNIHENPELLEAK